MERLDKIIANATTFSRKEVREQIRRGQATVDGKVVLQQDAKVDPLQSVLTYCGKPLGGAPYIYIMMHKPTGVVSATRDPKQPTVLDLVPPEMMRKGLFPAGRLDKDTTGFLLITNDGDFAHNILSPKHHISKTYLAVVDGPVPDIVVQSFANGLNIDSGDTCKPAQLEVLESSPTRTRTKVILTEGMYHQIKRMFHSFGLTVLELKRIAMGNLPLDEALAPGTCRLLTPHECDVLATDPVATGGRSFANVGVTDGLVAAAHIR